MADFAKKDRARLGPWPRPSGSQKAPVGHAPSDIYRHPLEPLAQETDLSRPQCIGGHMDGWNGGDKSRWEGKGTPWAKAPGPLWLPEGPSGPCSPLSPERKKPTWMDGMVATRADGIDGGRTGWTGWDTGWNVMGRGCGARKYRCDGRRVVGWTWQE